MIISFHVEYRTNWGEEVRILGSVPELGKNDPEQAVSLQTVDGTHWSVEREIRIPENRIIAYNYCIYRDGQPVRGEWKSFPRRIYLSGNNNVSNDIKVFVTSILFTSTT